MSSSLLNQVVAGTVWMTISGYPAIINEVDSSRIIGKVVSPSGTISCTWDEVGKNLINKPDFFDLKYAPDLISHKYAIIKDGALIGSAPSGEDANDMGALNNADLICKYSELT